MKAVYFLCVFLWSLGNKTWASAGLLKQLLQENRTEEAVPICRQYEILPSRDESVYFTCSWIYYRSYRPESGDVLLDKLKNSQALPEYQLLKIYSGVAKLLKAPEVVKSLNPDQKSEYQEKLKIRINEAQKEMETFIVKYKSQPSGKMAQELNAEFYELKGQLEPAAFLYRGLIPEYPKSARAYWGLGRYYLAQGDLRRAKSYLEKTAELWPKHLGSRYNLALIAIVEGPSGHKEAAKWLAEAFKLNRADVGVLEQIGVLLEANKKTAAAVKYWQRALELNPQAPIANRKLQQNLPYLVESLLEKKQWKEALSRIDSFAPEGEGKVDEFSLYRGICYRNLGEFQKAEKQLRPLVQLAEPNPILLRELGIVELNLKRTAEAIQLFERAKGLEKNEGTNFAWLGFAYEQQGEPLKALEAWSQAASLIKEPTELKRALEKVARLEQKTGKRVLAEEPSKSEPQAD